MQTSDANSWSSSEWLVFIYPVSVPRQTFCVLVVMEFTLDHKEIYNYMQTIMLFVVSKGRWDILTFQPQVHLEISSGNRQYGTHLSDEVAC